MGRKVFVSYKYKDNDVKKMPDVTQPTWPCDYVDYIKNKILSSDDIYKVKTVTKIFRHGARMPFGTI